MDNIAIAIKDALVAWGIPHQLITALISMIPLLELRGSILVAGLLNLPLIQTYISAIIGNMIPIPFILMFIQAIFNWMKKTKHLSSLPEKIESKALKKSEQIQKYGYLGLFLFVAIPLPGTGAWTGSLLAVLFGLSRKKSLLFILFGVMTAGLVMTLVSYGIIGIFI